MESRRNNMLRPKELSGKEVSRRNRRVRAARLYADGLRVRRHVSLSKLDRLTRRYVAEHTDLEPDGLTDEQLEDWMLRCARHLLTNYDELLGPVNDKPAHAIDYRVLRHRADELSAAAWPALAEAARRSNERLRHAGRKAYRTADR